MVDSDMVDVLITDAVMDTGETDGVLHCPLYVQSSHTASCDSRRGHLLRTLQSRYSVLRLQGEVLISESSRSAGCYRRRATPE